MYSITSNNREYLYRLKKLEFNFSKNHVNAPKALSFFAGAGGLCYGVKAAGFQIVGTSEINKGFRDIHMLNFPKTKQLTHDIRLFSENECNILLEEQGKIDLMIGGPPCQGFSLTGKRDVKDERNTLFTDYLRIARIIKPRVILMENVASLLTMKDEKGLLIIDEITRRFDEIGYFSKYFVVNSKDYNVPQNRKRIIFIASKTTDKITLPEKSTSIYTFGDAVSDLEYIESGEVSKTDKLHRAVDHPEHVIKWLVDVPEGRSAHENSDPKLRPPSGYNTTYKRQIWNKPASTVSTTFGMISGSNNVHPIATRSMTIREALRLQSFPDSFKVAGSLGDIRKSIGNAVPPLLAYELGCYIKSLI